MARRDGQDKGRAQLEAELESALEGSKRYAARAQELEEQLEQEVLRREHWENRSKSLERRVEALERENAKTTLLLRDQVPAVSSWGMNFCTFRARAC